MVLALNVASGHLQTGVWNPSLRQKGVLDALSCNAFCFVWGDRSSGSQVDSVFLSEGGLEDVT